MSERDARAVPQLLLEQAREVSEHAHSPYSGARVGAAVNCGEERVFIGCNVENASYGLTQCAERNALNAAIAHGIKRGEMDEMVIYASGFQRLSPCGACRQVMIELMAPDAVVHCCNEGGEVSSWSVNQLFPEPFVLE